jgi:uncharacterized protein
MNLPDQRLAVNQSILPLCGLVLIASAPVCAQMPEQSSSAITAGEARPEHRSNAASQIRHVMRDEVNAGLVGVISAGMEGAELGETTDLAASLDGARDHLRILPIAGKGAFQNATDIVFARGVDIGIIQSDVLAALKREPPFAGIENYLGYITKLYDEELHVLAGTQVRFVEDLASQKVNFGTRDSGTFVTATALFDALGITVDATNFPQPIALEKLRQGEIAALVYLAGKPARLFQEVRPDENLHFLSIRATTPLPESYTSAALTADDYPELIEANAPVSTVAMGTVLAVYNWPAGTERYRKVASFVQAFFERLHDMQSPAHHPKWREINLTASLPGWTRFPPAEEWIRQAGLNDGEPAYDSPRHAAVTEGGTAALSVQERDAIFKEFVDYRKRWTPHPLDRAGVFDPQQRDALFQEFAAYQKRYSHAAFLKQRPLDSVFAQFAAYQE